MALSNRAIAELAAQSAQGKKAHHVLVLDMREVSMIADFFVICSGNSETQVEAITDEVAEQMKRHAVPIYSIEGKREARWVLVNLGDVIVHIFHREDREFYRLERLWADAQEVQIPENVSQTS